MEYNFKEIEPRWQKEWSRRGTYRVGVDPDRPKYYILDMFPYPSGAGLHVGHPLGYIASDICTRYKRMSGFNVLHPMGFDAFGLPAEQYAIQTGQHPATTTAANIARYREQLDKLGFSYDWDRCVETCDPAYYKWTQWAFIRMFESYYCRDCNQARPIAELLPVFEQQGNEGLNAACTVEMGFTAAEWRAMSEAERADVLMNYRLAYRASTMVNWCEALGTVLANDEVKDGLSERGGHPVEQRRMMQWLLRVSAYAERLLGGLDDLAWSESLKEIQRNWIGKSTGAQMFFDIKGSDQKLEVFTTRPDTIYGVTFMVLAPEHDYLSWLPTAGQRDEVDAYIAASKKRSERERVADTRKVTGVFTGAYAVNPFTGDEIPIYISDYVLAGYGTGAIMAVPGHDSRDWAFARHFGLPIVPVVEGGNVEEASYDAKEGRMINSGIIDGLDVKEAIVRMFDEVEARGLGRRKVNYRLRDAIFSRQRYWGEPIPVYYKDGIPTALPFSALPLELPKVSDFSPSRSGEPPLARVADWSYEGWPLETSTMPGFAGSSAYYLRYMDPTNDGALVSREADEYWRDVDLYVGGIEHATGHLIYSRFWNKFLFDIGEAAEQEPFRKLVNQGMIQGRSNFVYRYLGLNVFVSLHIKEEIDAAGNFEELNVVLRKYGLDPIRSISDGPITSVTSFFNRNSLFSSLHVDVNIVRNDVLDTDAFKKWRPEFADAEFVLEDGKYVCGWGIEKMSKSMYNVVNPDRIVADYGADTLRMYEMFLGPLEASKPWDTNGIDGVHKFLRRFWRLFFASGDFGVSDESPTAAEFKTLHKTIKKVREDIENFSFNTSVAAFMICLNELGLCDKRQILEPLTILLAPFAPHITEELWSRMGHEGSIFDERMPEYAPAHLVESEFEYPVSVNGKLRFKKSLPLGISVAEIEAAVLADENAGRWLEGREPKKMIVVPGKIVNIVI
ncbi:MAG: class I tRNA ligase family protein [Alistipes sp.]|jgi:leucyl-tRNA synthetase|nr:class I tRNA ligase family protein [Alistipes sp.]